MTSDKLMISICGLSIRIDCNGQYIVAEIPDYRTMQELSDNIDKVLKEYNLEEING